LSTQDLSSNEQAKRGGINPTDAIVDLLEASVGPDLFDMWFNRGCIEVTEEATGCVVRVFAKNEFSVRRLQQTFSSEIKNAVERVCGPQTTILVEVAQADLAQLALMFQLIPVFNKRFRLHPLESSKVGLIVRSDDPCRRWRNFRLPVTQGCSELGLLNCLNRLASFHHCLFTAPQAAAKLTCWKPSPMAFEKSCG